MSTRRIHFNDPDDGAWIMRRCMGVYNDKTDQCISVRRDGCVVGGVVYSMFLKTAVMLHMAGSEDNWATPDFLWLVYDFAFNRLKVTWCLGLVDSANERALDIDGRMGFWEEARIKGLLVGGSDLVIVRMDREHCWALNKITPRYYVLRNEIYGEEDGQQVLALS